ncbi:MAG: hypothetical protein QG651_510, partial [Pseudomonadota bacterium]|nr:hypothetical protein [Pseudomonadota bacterium]
VRSWNFFNNFVSHYNPFNLLLILKLNDNNLIENFELNKLVLLPEFNKQLVLILRLIQAIIFQSHPNPNMDQ